jgi:nucleotide-binding universal stress UspA family protein
MSWVRTQRGPEWNTNRTCESSPSDGSAGAAAALDKLLATFLGPGLTIDLLAVVDRRPTPVTTVVPGGESDAAGLLGSERERLEKARIEVAVAVRTGHPAEEIVAFAAMRKPDLVIIGSRPATSLGPGFSGSVASKVARYSPSSVLIARDERPVVPSSLDSTPRLTQKRRCRYLPSCRSVPRHAWPSVQRSTYQHPSRLGLHRPSALKSGRRVTTTFRTRGWRPRDWPTMPPSPRRRVGRHGARGPRPGK